MICAVRNGYEDVVKTLLNNAADVNAKDNNGWTALMYMVINNRAEIIKSLEKD